MYDIEYDRDIIIFGSAIEKTREHIHTPATQRPRTEETPVPSLSLVLK